jgi:hypothetical protein
MKTFKFSERVPFGYLILIVGAIPLYDESAPSIAKQLSQHDVQVNCSIVAPIFRF